MPQGHFGRALAVLAASLFWAPGAQGAEPWEPAGDSEGPYIVQGTGPPNTRVALVRDDGGGGFFLPGRDDPPGNGSGEYTSPQGAFRLAEGNCNDDCVGGDDDDVYRVIFYDFVNDRVPIWAPNSYFRGGANESTGFDMPRLDHAPRSQGITYNTSGPASLPAYQTFSGVVNGASGPLADVEVKAFNAQARGPDSLSYAGHDGNVGQALSNSNGGWSIKIPPGQWAIRWTTKFNQPFFPYDVWSGCVRDADTVPVTEGTAVPPGTSFHASGSTVNVTFGGSDENSTCNGSAASTPGGGNPTKPTTPAGTGATPPPGTGGTTPSTPGRVTASGKAKTGNDGTSTLTLTVSGPGKVAASATSSVTASAKRKTTVAKGSARARRAGKVKLVLKPTRAGKKLLKKRRRLKATAKIRFTPSQGKATTIKKAVRFKLRRKKR